VLSGGHVSLIAAVRRPIGEAAEAAASEHGPRLVHLSFGDGVCVCVWRG
jgi:hypothetical protein